MLADELKKIIKGEVLTDQKTLGEYSHDASLFELRPDAVVFPKDADDIKQTVKFIAKNKKQNPNLSITARSAGTDMGGGALGESIVLVFPKYLNRIKSVADWKATAEPGVYYRDFEKETLKHGWILPSYPASREICAIGGMVSNNSGGEKTLAYGKTEDYVETLKVVLSDGNEYVFKTLAEKELKEKLLLKTFEGEVYRKMRKLLAGNYSVIQKAKPRVSKNSAGYYLWNVWDKQKKTFNLAALFVGAQGTLGIVTEATLRLVAVKKHSRMAVLFLSELKHVAEVAEAILPLKPESFESYDDHTLKLALKFFPSFAGKLGTKNILALAWQFLPELWMAVTKGIPKLILQIEFTGDDEKELDEKMFEFKNAVAPFNLPMRIARTPQEAKKYWLIRRESFNLLRERIKDRRTAPFIDDIVVEPERLSEFLPKLNSILERYPGFVYTMAGHVGDGNFHVIPLMDLKDESQRALIPELARKVYDLVIKSGGSISGEHNDGLIRTPFLKQMYGEKMYKLFEETKRIFDPQNIFNPRKKVGGDLDYAIKHIRKY